MLTITARRVDRFHEARFVPDLRPVVFVVHDDPAVCQLLAALASEQGWRSETFTSSADFLAEPRVSVPSCLVLDVGPPLLGGLDLQGQMARERKEMPVIFVTDHSDVPTTVRAMKGGASEFFIKPLKRDCITNAIRRALDRSQSALQDQSELDVLKDRQASLSGREKDVMGFVVSGLLNKQIAGELHISEITVKAHRGRMVRKMEARSLPDLVRMCARLDIACVGRRAC